MAAIKSVLMIAYQHKHKRNLFTALAVRVSAKKMAFPKVLMPIVKEAS